MKGSLVKIGEVAAATGFSVSTIRNWTNSGHIPLAMTTVKGTRLYDLGAVVDTLNRGELKSRASVSQGD